MRTATLVLTLLLLTGCESDKQAAAPTSAGAEKSSEAAAPAAGEAPDAKGRTPFVHCIDLIREKRYAEALTVCREAQESNPNDPQIKRAIEIAESGGES
jgi:Flp pilus assembly protein TadD